MRLKNIGLQVLLALALGTFSNACSAEQETAHWAYSSFLGTGWYQLDGDREVYILRMPPKWYWRKAEIDEDGNRHWGVEWQFPLTLGLHRLESLDDFVDLDNIGSVSFTPGVELEFPISDRWRLRPYAHIGAGTQTENDESALIWDAGIKTRYGFQYGALEWGLVGGVFFAGYNTNIAKASHLGGLLLAADFSYPISLRSGTGQPLNMNWDISYRRLTEDLTFSNPGRPESGFSDEWEIGLALAKRDSPIKIWFLNFQQMGLAYRFSSNGEFQAITVNFKAPFTR